MELCPCCTPLKHRLAIKLLSVCHALSHLQDSGDLLKTPSQLPTVQKSSGFVWVLNNSVAFGEWGARM